MPERRTAVAWATGLSTAALLASGLTTGSLPAASAAPHSATQDWTNVRLTCKTFTAGKVCVALQKGGTIHRGMFYIVPAAAQWIQPVARANWAMRDDRATIWNLSELGADGDYMPVCAGGCARLTSAWVYYAAYSAPAVHTLLFDTPQGRFDVSAGMTLEAHQATKTCPGPAQAAMWGRLTSTNDGNVWYQRSVGMGVAQPQRPQILQGTENGKPFYSKAFSGTYPSYNYTFRGPTLTRTWPRVRSAEGHWAIVLTRATLKYINQWGDVDYVTSDRWDAGPC